jgi:D-alanyl-D-alanine carboxypeptidase
MNESLLKALSIIGVECSLANSASNDGHTIGHVFAKTGTRAGSDELNARAMMFTKGIAGYVQIPDVRLLREQCSDR